MLRLPNIEEFNGLIRQLSSLVDATERGGSAALDSIDSWLRSAEATATSNRLPVAGDLAGLRAQLGLVRRGFLVDGETAAGHSKRSIREAGALDVLRKAATVLTAAVSGDAARVEEGRRIARQVVSVARVKQLIPAGSNTQEAVRAALPAWQLDADIGAATVHLVGLLGIEDTCLVLDHAITSDLDAIQRLAELEQTARER